MLVSRVAFDAVCAARDAEHENAQTLRRQLMDLSESSARDRETIERQHAEMRRLSDLVADWRSRHDTLQTELTRVLAATEHHRADEHARAAEATRGFGDLLARYHEVTSRIADIADNATKKPATIVTAPQPATEFKDFPPDVGAALAVANAGFRPDVVRANTLWAQQELARGEKSHVVAGKLMRGIPIPDDAMEA